MKIIKFIVVSVLIVLWSGCSKKSSTADIINVKEKDVTSVSLFVSTEEETDYLTIINQDGVKEILNLLNNIQVKKQLDNVTTEEPFYYDYQLYFKNDTSIRVIDYKDKIKIINRKGKVSWYEVKDNTWEALTPIWQKYYVDKSKSQVPLSKDPLLAGKPVIYLYPKETTEISVKIDIDGKLTYTYPNYHDEWRVLASSDGTLTNIQDGKVYSYLFWEGIVNTQFDLSRGFVVKGCDITKFLEEKLSYLGLSSKEYNDFIVYWAPKMSENNYNLITFQHSAYTDVAKLQISPEPDSILRVFMVYKPLDEYIKMPEQELKSWERTGFSVVEWGGSEIKN